MRKNCTRNSPIRRLPPEILSKIFEFVLLPEFSCKDLLHFIPRIDSLSGPFSLRRVCRKWNIIALTTPTLWTTIYPNIIHQIPLLTSFLQRSGTLSLAIHVRPFFSGHSSIISSLFLEGLSLLRQNLYRCRRLHLYGFNSGAVFEILFPVGTYTEVPLLQEFIVAHPFSDEARRFGFFHAPSLQTLAIPSCPRQDLMNTLPNSFASIQRLLFLDCSYYFHQTKTQQLIPFLRQLPNLKECQLYVPSINNPNSIPDATWSLPVYLPHLHDLNVTWLGEADADISHFFGLLQAPSLRHLRLQAYCSSTNLDLRTVLPTHITHLQLSNLDFNNPSRKFVAFDKLTALEEVWFKSCYQVETFLSDDMMRVDVCPHLSSLVFELCDFQKGVLIDVIEKRSSAALKVVNLIRCGLSDELRAWIGSGHSTTNVR